MKIEIDLNYEDNEILTQQFLGSFCIKILELLLHQRNQISFNYQMFKLIINKWRMRDDLENLDFNTQRQRNLGISTLNEIENIIKVIKKTFSNGNLVKTIRLLFGSTPTTPKEIYIINLPQNISNIHKDENHIHEHERLQSLLLRDFIISEEIFQVFCSPMVTTNIFLDFEFLNSNPSIVENNFTSKELMKFSPNCKEILINLKPSIKTYKFNHDCCTELKIFNDLIGKNQPITPNSTEDDNVSYNIVGENDSSWWEANNFIRGFKDKSKKLWDSK